MEIKRDVLVILIFVSFLVLGSVLFYFFVLGKSCNNLACFEISANKCSPARYNKIYNGNIFYYRISTSFGGICNLEIKIKEFGENTDPELRELFEGKNMYCKIPKGIFNSEFVKLGNSIDYCTGPLKEAMYELMIKRMYDLSVKQMGDVILEMGKTLEEGKQISL